MELSICAQLATACRVLGMEGLGDGALGHVSARIGGQEEPIYIKPTGLGLEEVDTEDICLINSRGEKLKGKHPLHKELPIHTEIYRAREDVNCVIHIHPLYCTVWASLDKPLRPISHEGAWFARGLQRFEETTDLILTPNQGKALASCLDDGVAVLMKNHGITLVGETIEEASIRAICLEKAAKVQWLAESIGQPGWTPDREIDDKIEHIFNRDVIVAMWEYYERKLSRQQSVPFDI